jgi:hypothetical protein
LPITYDRTGSDELVAVLSKGGWANSLVKFAKFSPYALDLQLRGSTKSDETWATLYVGLGKVLDLRHSPRRGFRLRAHETLTTSENGWRPSWACGWWKDDTLTDEWEAVELYLERAIPKVPKSALVEGALQTAISVFANDTMLPIDREAALSYSDQSEKDRIRGKLQGRLLAATDPPGDQPWWASVPKTLGGECDVLAIAPDGTLLAVEIKPRTSTSTIRWAPLQARHYANLFSAWASQDEHQAKAVLDNMVRQRFELGLITEQREVILPIRVQPIVAIGRGFSESSVSGLMEVQGRLDAAGLNDPPLRLYRATLWGELEEIPALTSGDTSR